MIGEAFSVAMKQGRTIEKFILRPKLYFQYQAWVTLEMKKRDQDYRGEELEFNGIPVDKGSILQTESLVVEYKKVKTFQA